MSFHRGGRVAVRVSKKDTARRGGEARDLWAAIEAFRAETDLEELDIAGALEGVRDPSPGRDPEI